MRLQAAVLGFGYRMLRMAARGTVREHWFSTRIISRVARCGGCYCVFTKKSQASRTICFRSLRTGFQPSADCNF